MKALNIKTLYKIENEIDMLGNQSLANELFAYENGLKKRVEAKVVRGAVETMIKDLKNTKITKLDDVRYLVEAGSYQCDFIGKEETKEAYETLTKIRLKRLENFIKKYL